LLRCFERLLRRANVPVAATAGFNPHPKLVFAQSLALGIIGHNEIVDIDLDQTVEIDDLLARLARHAPPGLDILSAERIDLKARAHAVAATYRAPIPNDLAGSMPQRLATLLAQQDWPVERTLPHPRRLDLRPYVTDLRWDGKALEIDVALTPHGSARPEEVLALLGLDDLPSAGVLIERTHLKLADQQVAASPPAPALTGPGAPAPLPTFGPVKGSP
jgi:radical SAM-linked protein